MELDRTIDAEGTIIRLYDGRMQAHPAVGMARQAWAEVRKWSVEFGLTPSARSRVREVEQPDDADTTEGAKDDPEAFFFGGRVVGSIGA
jgi:P27 family predicted phage terminase small subunit